MVAANLDIYNVCFLSLHPSTSTYIHEVTDLTTVDPSAGAYDYKFEVTADLNAVLTDFTYERDPSGNTHSVTNEADAWADLQALLSTGTALNGEVLASATTTMSDGDTTSRLSWDTFWAGLLSECIDSADKNGLSVKLATLKERIDYPTNLGSHADVAAANAASFLNDVTGVLNDALGATNTLVGGGAITSITDNAFGTKAIQTAPNCSNFFAALAHFLYDLRGASVAGNDGSLSGDPSDGPVKFALFPGDRVGLRFSCTMTNVHTGLILIQQT